MDDQEKIAVARMKLNDPSGFDHLFYAYHKKIYYFCLKNGLNEQDSQEVVQEVFTKFWLTRKKLDPSRGIQAYLYKIAKNQIIDEFRKRVKRKAAEVYQIRLLETKKYDHQEMEYQELVSLIRDTLRSLPEKRRIAFELSRYSGLSNQEIANEMGISIKTVELHLKLALQTFRNIIKQSEIMGISGLILICLFFN